MDANVERILACSIILEEKDNVMQDLGPVLSSSSAVEYNDAYGYNTQVNYIDTDLSSSDETDSETEDWA